MIRRDEEEDEMNMVEVIDSNNDDKNDATPGTPAVATAAAEASSSRSYRSSSTVTDGKEVVGDVLMGAGSGNVNEIIISLKYVILDTLNNALSRPAIHAKDIV